METTFMKFHQIGLFFVGLSICSTTYSQDTASVLFIGNSYTYANDLPTMLQNLAASFGDVVTKDSQTPGGATFQTHVNNQATFNKIGLENWDFVVLQGQSQEPSFSDAQVNTQTIPYAKQLADSIYANNFCSEVLMYMTWGRENGDPQWAPISTFDGMNARLRSAYMRIADTVQGSVAPVGVAWKYVRDNYPSINLYVADGSHPSVEGTYLAACTFYSAMFRKSPVGSTFLSTVDPNTATILQSAAELSVMDSLEQWNVRPLSEHTQAEFYPANWENLFTFWNYSTKATNYSWDFGDGNSSTDVSPTHTYANTGIYNVTLIAESPCDSDTISYQVHVTVVSVEELFEERLELAHLESGVYSIKLPVGPSEIELYSAEGRKVAFNLSGEGSVKLDFRQAGEGIYLLKIKTNEGESTVRLLY